MKTLTLFVCGLLMATFLNAQIIHVPAGQPTIQAGIDAATTGDTVLVADGTYLENINFWGKAITVGSHFIMDADTNHINNTIIDGSQPANPDYGSVVTFITGEDTTSIISGFTITGGTGLLDASIPARLGGGIVCINASAKITHNKIIANEVDHQTAAIGAGIACTMYLQSKWIVIEHNVIADNYNNASDVIAQGGGIYIGENTGSNIELRARVSHNTIENNTCYSTQNRADGGGIKIEGSDGVSTIIDFNHNLVRNNSLRGSSTRGAGLCGISAGADIENNVFSGNYIDVTSGQFRGSAICFKYPYHRVNINDNEISSNISPINYSDCTGAVSIMDGYDIPVVVDKNIFTNNVAYHGAGFYSRRAYHLIISNNIFSGNNAHQGAALSSYHTLGDTLYRPLVVNNTFFGNTATNAGGAIRFNGELNTPIILNCIFWENEAPTGKNIRNDSGLELVVSYSDVDPIGISGMWGGTANFHADPEFITGDTLCHLGLTSPCKNTGTASLDVDGTIYYAPLVDFDGETRPDPQHNLFDVGADEYWGLPDPPVALDPDSIGTDFFVARWESSTLAMGYYLDVAFDADFGNMVPGYDTLDVGNDTTFPVENLESVDYYYRVRAYNAMYVSENSNVIAVLTVGILPSTIENQQSTIAVYPNPFIHQTTLEFTLQQGGHVHLAIYNQMGERVAMLADDYKPAGVHKVSWNATGLPNGIYFVEVRAEQEVGTRKIVKIK